MLNKYVGGMVRASMDPVRGATQTILIISKEQDKAIELIIDAQNGVVKSAHEVTLKRPEPPKTSKIIKFDPLYKKKKERGT